MNLKKLDRLKKREWQRNGKSQRYLDLKSRFDAKYKEASAKYTEKNVRELMTSQPGKAYSTLKKMGAQPGDDLDNSSFTIIEHLEKKRISLKKKLLSKLQNIFQELAKNILLLIS